LARLALVYSRHAHPGLVIVRQVFEPLWTMEIGADSALRFARVSPRLRVWALKTNKDRVMRSRGALWAR
jgi:hypothetical protein